MNHDKNVTTTIGHLIDGKLVADTERTQPVFNPATGQSTTSVALASKATVEAAIASAEAAFPAWRNTPPLKRARVMSKLKVLRDQPYCREGVVEFEAFWRQGAARGSLHERSRFVREDRHWYYVDGDVR